MKEDIFDAPEDVSADEVTKHLHDAINHRESLDLTFANGDFVELDVHTMQYIINKDLVSEMIDSTDSPAHFQAFLDKVFPDADNEDSASAEPSGDTE